MPPVKLRARSHSYSHLNCWLTKGRLFSITLMGAVLPVFGAISDEGVLMTPLVTLSEQQSTDWKLINDTVMGAFLIACLISVQVLQPLVAIYHSSKMVVLPLPEYPLVR
ncbi:hypothetical protein [Shewanella woodyi]|uniref:hypothetical protein n=1 Tax=Shewanella woodyi TaxID=60961 RepID=UPI0000E78FAB|nr:hypothetical protein [Shewanella woodyi]